MPYADPEAQRAWYQRNHVAANARNRAWKVANREHYSRQQLAAARVRKYGISDVAFASLLAAQNGACGICCGPRGQRQWHVDHDHQTNEIRGVLCFRCNAMLGHAKDRLDVLMAAVGYLTTPPARKVH